MKTWGQLSWIFLELLFLTSSRPHRAKITPWSYLHGNLGWNSPLKAAGTGAGLSKLLPHFMPALVPGFTQECVGQGDFVGTINNGGDIWDLSHYYPDCKITRSTAWTWWGELADGLERDSVVRSEAERASGEPTLKSTGIQQAWWCSTALLVPCGCWPLPTHFSLLA